MAAVSSAAQLQAAVQQNPAPWRDGTGDRGACVLLYGCTAVLLAAKLTDLPSTWSPPIAQP